MPRPVTFNACVQSCETIFAHLANRYDEKGQRKSISCGMKSLRKHMTLPQASLPKNAAIDGCRTATYSFGKCMDKLLGPVVISKEEHKVALRGAASVNMADHLAKHWKKEEDPLL